MTDQGLVLVTGGSGYVAGFCIAHLLQNGWRVRATLRAPQREREVREAIGSLVDPGGRLGFAVADLGSDAGWKEAAAGCTYVQHVASPLPAGAPKHDDELVRPARDGALRVLGAARDAGVRRVVMTSSTASVSYGFGSLAAPRTEADWSDETNLADTSAYERSKTIAERAAWSFMQREGGALELTVVNPGAVVGPLLGRDFSASIDIVKKMLDGSVPGIPRFGWPLVDVRDVADLHYRAMLAPQAAGQRYIGAGRFLWMSDVAAILRQRVPARAGKVPSLRLPNWVVRVSSLFDPAVRRALFELDKARPVSSDKAKRDLGWSPRPAEESIVATAESLIALGIV